MNMQKNVRGEQTVNDGASDRQCVCGFKSVYTTQLLKSKQIFEN